MQVRLVECECYFITLVIFRCPTRAVRDLTQPILVDKRTKFIKELLSSEEAHVEALKTVVVDYLQPLRQIISKEKLKKARWSFFALIIHHKAQQVSLHSCLATLN